MALRISSPETCDVLGDSKPYLVKDFQQLNAAHVVLIDTNCRPRTLWSDETLDLTVLSSCFDYPVPGKVSLSWKLKDRKKTLLKGKVRGMQLKYPGVGRLSDLHIPMPFRRAPSCLTLEIELNGKKYQVSNRWKFWVFPRFDAIKEICGNMIYTNIKWVHVLEYATDYFDSEILPTNADLVITDRLGAAELEYLDQGGRILLLQDHAKEGLSCIPSTYRHRMYHN